MVNLNMKKLLVGKGMHAQLARAGIGSFAIRIGNLVIGLLLAVVLARALGPEGYGIYTYVFTLVSILAIPAQFGLPRLVIRETARAQVNEQWGVIRGIWRWSTALVVVLSVVLSLLALAAYWLVAGHFNGTQQAAFLWSLVLVPTIVLSALRGAMLQGLRQVVLGMLPETILRPGGLVLAIFFTIWLGESHHLSPATAMGIHVVVAGLALLVGIWFLHRSCPPQLIADPAPVYESRLWLTAVLPLALSAGVQQINRYSDIVMLGYIVSAEDVGIYRVSSQGAGLVAFGLQTVAMFVSPYFAQLHAQKKHEYLQKLIVLGSRVSLLVALFIMLVFVFWGDEIIRIAFGADYISSYMPLMILGVGQLVNALFGPIGILLNMTGFERDTMRGMSIAALANVLLNLIFIPLYGINGAATSTTLALCIWNALLWFYGFFNWLEVYLVPVAAFVVATILTNLIGFFAASL